MDFQEEKEISHFLIPKKEDNKKLWTEKDLHLEEGEGVEVLLDLEKTKREKN
jgi:hypothetical protein